MCYTRSIGVAQKHDFESTTPQTAQSWLIGQHNAFENRAFAWMPASSFAGSPRCEIQPRSIRTFSIKFSLFFRVFSSSAWLDFFSVQPAGLASWTGSTRFPKIVGFSPGKSSWAGVSWFFIDKSSWAGSCQLFLEHRVELDQLNCFIANFELSSTRFLFYENGFDPAQLEYHLESATKHAEIVFYTSFKHPQISVLQWVGLLDVNEITYFHTTKKFTVVSEHLNRDFRTWIQGHVAIYEWVMSLWSSNAHDTLTHTQLWSSRVRKLL